MNKYKKSIEFFKESCSHFAGGVGSNPRFIPELGFPLFFEKGLGSKIYDVDGNEYIDYVLAMGPLILGHCPPVIVETIKKQLELGTIFGSSFSGEIELSRRICECLPSVELVRFTNSGSEAVHMALRLARAYTGRSKVLKFEGAYHGWFDNIMISVHPEPSNLVRLDDALHPILETPGQCKSVLKDILIVPWNRLDVVKKTIQRHGKEIGSVVMEPIICNNGVIPPLEGFLEGIREITKKNEIVLIFDEIITGFRLGLGGAQEYYNITPDLTVFGKAMGGGYPIAGFGGVKEIMTLVSEGKVGHFGTYNSNPLCVSAAITTLSELAKDNGGIFRKITSMGKKLMQGVKEIFSKKDIPVVLQGPGPFFSTFFIDKPIISYRDTINLNRALYSRFWVGLLGKGIRIWPTARGIWYLSAAHTDGDIDFTLDAIGSVVKDMR